MIRSFRMATALLMLGALGGCERIDACLQTQQKAASTPVVAPIAERPISLWSHMYSSNVCPPLPATNIAPSVYERGQYDERTRTGKLTEAIAIGCVLYVYSPMQLDEWNKKGDPVAALATILLMDQRDGFFCSNSAGTKDLLGRAAAVPANPGGKISRVPEIYDVIDNIDIRCGTPLDPANQKKAEASGFFIGELTATQLN